MWRARGARPRALRFVAVMLAMVAMVGSCSSSDHVLRGIVVDVQGDLVQIDRFTVLTDDGERIELVPAPDVRFHDGTPLSHLTEHLRNGDPIEVTYEELDDGTRAATRVEDVS